MLGYPAMSTQLLIADYHNPRHAADLGHLLDSYARDPMGNGAPLPDHVRENLAAELARQPSAFSILVYVDDTPAAFANCFMGFSTFQCRPLVNIHDFAVHPDFRGRGLARQLLQKIEEIAAERQCCKITLEVLEGNPVAQAAYRKFGFAAYALDPDKGTAQFWEKPL